LVTGSAGFIGSTLVRRLLDEGAEVVGVDCITDAYDPSEKEARLAALRARAGYSHLRIDLAGADLAEHLSGVETVFHLAGRPGVRDSFELYPQYVHDNIEATRRLLQAAVAAPDVRRLVYASSSSVYGNAPLPFSEAQAPNPISPYGRTKLEAEILCLRADGPRLGTLALRYFTVYGPEQRPDMALRKFAQAALDGTPIEVYGDGAQSRDFTYVDDIVEATYRAGQSAASGLAINVGGGSRVTINEVLTMLAEITGRELNVVHQESARGDVRHTVADLSRAAEYLQLTAQVGLRQGLTSEVAWLRARGGMAG
jgi:nucleoside-diphosphate-sugar epimerase